jgi:hypothetical protein
MQITFDTDMFGKMGEKSLTNVLCYLKRSKCFAEGHYPDIERITCRTPSAALRYVRYFAHSGVTSESETVFLKNPNLGVRYLRMVGKPEFSCPNVQRKFRKKFKNDPDVAYEWARAFNTRLSEEEEEVFRKDVSKARDYAMYVIKGKFSEKVHGMLVLASFEDLTPTKKRHLADYIKFAEGR